MKIAVTSASGNLGSAVINQLKQELDARDIIGIARTAENAKHLGVEVRKGDYNVQADFNLALKDVDAVLLVSGMDHPDKRIEQHRNVIEAAKNTAVKKIVYTSIIGAEKGNAFSAIVASNRQTEEDIRQSGLQWAIGRNGIYIEPDLEYIEIYKQEGAIINCAADGKCAYTSRQELAFAYTRLLMNDELQGKTYNLCGVPITQQELADAINLGFNTKLTFKNIPVDAYILQRQTALGEFLGTIIGGIYEGIRNGANDVASDFLTISKRPHKSVNEMIKEFKLSNQS
ncbi:SDR family NAD(P)-dependent oxidoreductase [Carboxylicivirga sp. M1479]|nr:SDR family NAD(P)-dependent oxidoreductase [Carboxylicivirga sp. M1479]